MPSIPDLFVTAHAIEQFRQRIARMEAARARQMILDGIAQATDVQVLPDGTTLRVRTRRPFPFEFRAYCVLDPERGHMVVTTVVRGDRNVTRKHKRRRGPAPGADMPPAEGSERG